jgi:hypothetical protein
MKNTYLLQLSSDFVECIALAFDVIYRFLSGKQSAATRVKVKVKAECCNKGESESET